MSSRAPPKPPLCYRLVRDASGQSESIGVLLLLAVTVIGSVGIVAFGSTALDDTEDASATQRTEHTMTLFDSRSAMVALGDAESQSVQFSGTGGGSFEVREDAGWIRIEHHNYTAENPPKHEVIYNQTLGEFAYENGDTEIVYQGGGVWRRDGEGTRMVSPPELHYRGSTLTLPVIQVQGDTQVSGDSRIVVSSVGEHDRIFPNVTASSDATNEVGARYNDTEDPYVNPIENGTINVTVHSEYYRAWATYFEERTTSKVTVWHHNDTVTMQLLTLGEVGEFEMPDEGNGISVGGMGEEHTVSNFTVTVKEDPHFNNMHWSWWAEAGNAQFEMHVHSPAQCSDIASGSADLDVSIYYNDRSSGDSQEWQNQAVSESSDFLESIDCSQGTMTFNFTAANTDLTYTEIDGIPNSGSKWYFGSEINDNDIHDSLQFTEHSADTSTTYDESPGGDTANMSYLVDHYFGLMSPNFELTVADGPGGSSRIDEGESYGNLAYTQGEGRYLTFLHITENRVEIDSE